MKIYPWLAFIVVCLATGPCLAQIEIDTSRNVKYLVNEILIGQGVLAGNVTYNGAPYSIGLFKDEAQPLGIEEGIILSSGNVFFSAGPNKSPRTGWASNMVGDEDLNTIAQGKTYDAAVLEFDFITTSENLIFKFVFASEEYQEYVGSKFNDVFGFFLTGPNADHVNLATLPDGKTTITINNVNHETGEEYYIDNPYYNNTDPFVWDFRKQKVVKNKRFQKKVEPPRYNIQFDGFTVVLNATYEVIPNEIYHIKMAIADVSDGILDSGVFLVAGSFQSYGEQITTISKSFKFPDEERQGILMASEEKVTVGLIEEIEILDTEDDFDKEQYPALNVLFEFDTYIVPKDHRPIIENVVHILEQNPELVVVVRGHTDNRGSIDYNVDLSENRSNAVIQELLKLGINSDRIHKHFFGESVPISSNDTDMGRALNRRVEFVINKPQIFNK